MCLKNVTNTITLPKNWLKATEIYKVQQGDFILVPQNLYKQGIALKKQSLTEFNVITEEGKVMSIHDFLQGHSYFEIVNKL